MSKMVGICVGSATASVVSSDGQDVVFRTQRHGGEIASVLQSMASECGIGPDACGVFVGEEISLPYVQTRITEAAAVEYAVKALAKEMPLPDAVMVIGGQATLLYTLSADGSVTGIESVDRCGAGSGEFILQQLRRLKYERAEDACAAALHPEVLKHPYVPASRCAVFCKSDCTHAANEQKASLPQIVAGLFKTVANRVVEFAKKAGAERLWVVGGGSRFTPVLHFVRESGVEVTIPPHAEYFEAFGAFQMALSGTMRSRASCEADADALPQKQLVPLRQYEEKVRYVSLARATPVSGQPCLLGLDIGSTSTKAVLLSLEGEVLASYYGYTKGEPHEAIIENLRALKESVGVQVKIVGILSTGSGRNIADILLTGAAGHVHVLAMNEITCHATAAFSFDPAVSCILEIGGQDAKYTRFNESGSPVDAAMNEACSAGTGSFLAEVVREIFQITDPRDIAPIAMRSNTPALFGEHCSAFIQSDITGAVRDGVSQEDIVAGLCYAIIRNYIYRVVGNRPIQGRIFVQGGTAYNRAFNAAMAAVLTENGVLSGDNKIVVPEDAGLMGAIGAGLYLKRLIEAGEYQPFEATIDDLLGSTMEKVKTVKCPACDMFCDITTYRVRDGQGTSHTVPFGGRCGRWDNVRHGKKALVLEDLDLSLRRDELMHLHSDKGDALPEDAPKVGMLGNFFELSYLPLMSSFFAGLGCRTVLADAIDPEGVKRLGAPFCYPAERSFGLFSRLMQMGPDFYWMPHVLTVGTGSVEQGKTCTLSQGTAFNVMQAFPEVPQEKCLAPQLTLCLDEDILTTQLVEVGARLGCSKQQVRAAVRKGIEAQRAFVQACQEEGQKVLAWLDEDPARTAYVLVGRPYNAFSNHLGASKGISRKISSLGIKAVPLDFLPLQDVPKESGMYWSSGDVILRGARYIAEHPQLFAVFLSNFSCAPDSMIVERFSSYMNRKPSVFIEFDGHTAGAGYDTRIEAFHEMVRGYLRSGGKPAPVTPFADQRMRAFDDSLRQENTCVVFPDMGRYNVEALSAVMSGLGVRTRVLPPPTVHCLEIGRSNSSCKECAPYSLTLGSFLEYLQQRPDGEDTVLFMPGGTGPCRFGQYQVNLRHTLEQDEIERVTVMSLFDSGGYGELGVLFRHRAWMAVVTASAMENIRLALRVLAEDPQAAAVKVEDLWQRIVAKLRSGVNLKDTFSYASFLKGIAGELASIPLKRRYDETARILLTGEIYVRLSSFTTRPVVDHLVAEGYIPVIEPPQNWVKYVDLMEERGHSSDKRPSWLGRVGHKLKTGIQEQIEKQILKALARSGLAPAAPDDVEHIVAEGAERIPEALTGEAILTIGSVRADVGEKYHGAVVIGPFGCMPTRIATDILSRERDEEGGRLPIAFVDVDGRELPDVLKRRLDVLAQAARNRQLSL